MDLLGPEILCEITIHVMPDFGRQVYVSKLDTNQQTIAKIVEAIIQTGIEIGQRHGVTIQFGPPPKPGGAP